MRVKAKMHNYHEIVKERIERNMMAWNYAMNKLSKAKTKAEEDVTIRVLSEINKDWQNLRAYA